MDDRKPDEGATHREYSGVSHHLLVLTSPAIGLIASVLAVIYGPYAWWINWLIVGAVWGVTTPIRALFRTLLKYVTLEFRSPEFSWATCVIGVASEEWQMWRSEPIKTLGALLGRTLCLAAGWPVFVPIGAIIQSQVDEG